MSPPGSRLREASPFSLSKWFSLIFRSGIRYVWCSGAEVVAACLRTGYPSMTTQRTRLSLTDVQYIKPGLETFHYLHDYRRGHFGDTSSTHRVLYTRVTFTYNTNVVLLSRWGTGDIHPALTNDKFLHRSGRHRHLELSPLFPISHSAVKCSRMPITPMSGSMDAYKTVMLSTSACLSQIEGL